MKKKYTLKVVKYFEFPTQEEADAFADFQMATDNDTFECLKVEIEKNYEKEKSHIWKNLL